MWKNAFAGIEDGDKHQKALPENATALFDEDEELPESGTAVKIEKQLDHTGSQADEKAVEPQCGKESCRQIG